MDHGEPPGRSLDEQPTPDNQPPVTQQSQKPVRIDVSFSHVQSDVSGKHVLTRPFGDLVYEATVEQVTLENNQTMRKTIGVLMGPTSTRVNGHVQYKATVSANPDKAEFVRERLVAVMDELQRQYRVGFSDVMVNFAQPLVEAAVTSDPGVTLELSHETTNRNGEQREDDRDFSGTGEIRA